MEQLDVYAAQLGWLHAAPRSERSKAPPVPRITSHTGPMPPVDATWLIDYWHQCGTVDSAGMGAMPLAWSTITGWQVATGTPLAGWEVVAIRQMSAAYARMLRDGEDAGCPPPWRAVDDEQRQRVSDQVRTIFGGRSSGKSR